MGEKTGGTREDDQQNGGEEPAANPLISPFQVLNRRYVTAQREDAFEVVMTVEEQGRTRGDIADSFLGVFDLKNLFSQL